MGMTENTRHQRDVQLRAAKEMCAQNSGNVCHSSLKKVVNNLMYTELVPVYGSIVLANDTNAC